MLEKMAKNWITSSTAALMTIGAINALGIPPMVLVYLNIGVLALAFGLLAGSIKARS